jgi:hypothetical protein
VPATAKKLFTVGRISQHLGEPVHRIDYVIDSRGIEPSGIAGAARVFDIGQVEQIAEALREIDRRREGR